MVLMSCYAIIQQPEFGNIVEDFPYIFYTSNLNWSGIDYFSYLVSDGEFIGYM